MEGDPYLEPLTYLENTIKEIPSQKEAGNT